MMYIKMTDLSTTAYEHVQLKYLSSRTWTVDPVRIDSPVEGAYLRYTNNIFAWDLSGPNILGFDSTYGTFKQSDVINNYVILEVDESIYPGERVGLVIQPRNVGNIANSFLSTQIPDGLVLGGNVRGNYAIDMQMNRNSPDQVASGESSTISGGGYNKTNGKWSTVGGGSSNRTNGESSTISGGANNQSSGRLSTISGGSSNIAEATFSVIGGGDLNQASGVYSTISGGDYNKSGGERSTIGGGNKNNASGIGSTISGGYLNNASEKSSTVGGGINNTASGRISTIGGGYDNIASGDYSTISGGENESSGEYSTISGGKRNKAIAKYSAIGGGEGNIANSDHSYVIGKYNKSIDDMVFMVGWGDDKDNRKTIFSVDDRGYAYAKSHYFTGADVAEYYETVDQLKLPVGTTVIFVDNKDNDHYIRASNNQDAPKLIAGVVSDTGGVILNEEYEWHRKYLNGTINKLYDVLREYKPRSKRAEWHAIGLVGKCRVLKNQVVGDRWLLINATDPTYDWYLVK